MSRNPIMAKDSPALAGALSKRVSRKLEQAAGESLEAWGKFAALRRKNEAQQTNAYKNAKAGRGKNRIIGLNASAALYWCGRRVLAEKVGENYNPVGAMYCGKKYCAVCSKRKRNKILNRFVDYFESEAGAETLKKYDLCLFTVTLQHSKNGIRKNPYYKELSTHWRNALKYGSFKKYIAGGFYNTEHTYTANGHHIHRHALVLIPREYNALNFFKQIESELRTQWSSRTGGSFQIDLRPLGWNEHRQEMPRRETILSNIKTHMLEVTKYITKRDKDSGVIPWEVVKAVEENARTKFYGRFGVLHRVKALNINQEEEIPISDKPRDLYAVTPRVKFVKVKQAAPQNLPKKLVSEVLIKQDGYYIPKLSYLDDLQLREKQYKGQRFNKQTPRTREKTVLKAVAVSFEDITPIRDTREDIAAWKEGQRHAQYNWKTDRWNKLQDGHTVKIWKQSRHTLERLQNNFFEQRAEFSTLSIGPADMFGGMEFIYKSNQKPF